MSTRSSERCDDADAVESKRSNSDSSIRERPAVMKSSIRASGVR